jgi:hypothetical protein
MFPDPLVLKDAAAANKSLTKVTQTGTESLRHDFSTPASSQRFCRFRSNQTGKPGQVADRRNMVLGRNLDADTNGRSQVTLLSLTAQISREATSAAYIDDLWAMLVDFVSGTNAAANKASFLRGES